MSGFKEEVDDEVCTYCEENILGCCSMSSTFQCEGCSCEQALEDYNYEVKNLSLNLIPEKMENSLQSTKIESPDKLEVIVLCPGLSKEEVTIAFDKKEGILEIQGVPKKNQLSKAVELNINGKVNISPKYRSAKQEAEVTNGILSITFGLSDDVDLIDIK